MKALKEDKNEIFRVASAASAATDYVLGRSRTRDMETPGLAANMAAISTSVAVEQREQRRFRGR
jgi:antirestriction protein ArdC